MSTTDPLSFLSPLASAVRVFVVRWGPTLPPLASVLLVAILGALIGGCAFSSVMPGVDVSVGYVADPPPGGMTASIRVQPIDAGCALLSLVGLGEFVGACPPSREDVAAAGLLE